MAPVSPVPVERCSEERFIAEVKAQLLRCGSLDDVFYRVGAPHVLELLRAGVLVALVVLVVVWVSRV